MGERSAQSHRWGRRGHTGDTEPELDAQLRQLGAEGRQRSLGKGGHKSEQHEGKFKNLPAEECKTSLHSKSKI